MDAALRLFELVRHIPRSPQSVSAPELRAILVAHGYPVTLRSIQRDLVTLSASMPITCREGRPSGWSWVKDAPSWTMPAVSPETGLALLLAYDHVSALLPRPLDAALRVALQMAESSIARPRSAQLKRWRSRVRTVDTSLRLLAPDINPGVLETVHRALLERRPLSVVYRPRSEEGSKPRTYTAHPLGLVERQGVIVLVATLFDYTDVRQLVLHRMRSASVLDGIAREPAGFSLDRYLAADQAFDYAVGKPIRLTLDVTPWIAEHLRESRLSADQRIATRPSNDRPRLHATVANTQKLRWWLMSMSEHVRVVAPTALRTDLVARLHNGGSTCTIKR